MIFSPNSAVIRTMPFKVCSLALPFGFFGPFELAGYWYLYGLVTLCSIINAVYLAACCNRYLWFAASLYFTVLTALLLPFWRGFYMALGVGFGLEPQLAAPLSCLPVALCALVTLKFWHQKQRPARLIISGSRATYIYPYRDYKYFPHGLLIGCSTYAGSILVKHTDNVTGLQVIGPVCMALYGLSLFYIRHYITSLGHLYRFQKSRNITLTFWNITEIEDARRNWWLYRIVRWAGLLLSSQRTR
jgi:hypothetical protein